MINSLYHTDWIGSLGYKVYEIMSTMQVNEIFKSIQGEGPNFGKPAIFLRTAQCNLKCTWCDTKYTWDWEEL